MALLGIIGGLLGGFAQGQSAKKAAQAQVQAAQLQVDEQRRQYDTTRGDFQPYRAAGTNALDRKSVV